MHANCYQNPLFVPIHTFKKAKHKLLFPSQTHKRSRDLKKERDKKQPSPLPIYIFTFLRKKRMVLPEHLDAQQSQTKQTAGQVLHLGERLSSGEENPCEKLAIQGNCMGISIASSTSLDCTSDSGACGERQSCNTEVCRNKSKATENKLANNTNHRTDLKTKTRSISSQTVPSILNQLWFHQYSSLRAQTQALVILTAASCNPPTSPALRNLTLTTVWYISELSVPLNWQCQI